MSPLPNTSESLLVRLADPADQAAWEQFVATYEAAVAGYCRNRGLQDADAAEVLQEVLLAVHRQIGNWQPSGHPRSFRTWLLRTTHNICLQALRERAKVDRSAGGTDGHLRIQQLAAEDQRHDPCEWQRWAFQWAARQIQTEVHPTTWDAFWLTAVRQLPAEAVADRLGVRVGAVYTNKCRVLAKIRERVQELSRSEA